MGAIGRALGVGIAVLGGAGLIYLLTRPAQAQQQGSTYNVPFTVALIYGSGVELSGQSIVVSIIGTDYTTTVTTAGSGTVSGELTGAVLIPGQTYTLSASYAGGTVSGTYYDPCSGTVPFIPSSTAASAMIALRPSRPAAAPAFVIPPYVTVDDLTNGETVAQGATLNVVVTRGTPGGPVSVFDSDGNEYDDFFDDTGTYSMDYVDNDPAFVTLYAVDQQTGVSSNTVTVDTTQVPPPHGTIIVDVTVNPRTGVAGTTVISGSASASGGTGPYTYQWNWFDGTTSTGATASRVYPSAGTYNVSCTVTDSLGAQGLSALIPVMISAPPSVVTDLEITYTGGAALHQGRRLTMSRGLA